MAYASVIFNRKNAMVLYYFYMYYFERAIMSKYAKN